MKEKGKLIVVSGPSGVGKSTVVFNAIGDRNDCCFSTSVTTRDPRPGELDGREYFFVDDAEFDRMIENNELLALHQALSISSRSTAPISAIRCRGRATSHRGRKTEC